MAESFIWRKISEQEKQEIERKAKKILDDFAGKLEKIKTTDSHFESSLSKDGLREEGECWETDEEFRSTMFSNAPFADENLIVAEKGGWK